MEEKSLQRQGGVTKGVHKVYLNARKSAVMSGVKDVLSFDAKEVNRLSLEIGEVDVDGRIDSFAYSDVEEAGKKAASFLGRLFQ